MLINLVLQMLLLVVLHKEILDKLGVKDPEEDILKIEEAARVVVYELPGGERTPTPRPIYLENGAHVCDVPLDMADDVQDVLRERIVDGITGLFDVEEPKTWFVPKSPVVAT